MQLKFSAGGGLHVAMIGGYSVCGPQAPTLACLWHATDLVRDHDSKWHVYKSRKDGAGFFNGDGVGVAGTFCHFRINGACPQNVANENWTLTENW